eukprot:1145051-Pelagomonas_calceolata.AAC.4
MVSMFNTALHDQQPSPNAETARTLQRSPPGDMMRINQFHAIIHITWCKYRLHSKIYTTFGVTSNRCSISHLRPLTPMPTAAKGVAGQWVAFHKARATPMLESRPPRAPSTVFLGLISVNLVRPRPALLLILVHFYAKYDSMMTI